eukprot:GILK01005030.1.p1 GENE.GILK01005030.1~~GILK01005030.1.p1  ORF type:complete len:416 (-),score=27.49 GILK01005030.1:177-1370(-)
MSYPDFELDGKIGEGTYGLVYKGRAKDQRKKVALKKFKATREGEGISLTAYRELKVLREFNHENIINLDRVIMDPNDSSMTIVFDYAAHDLLQIIQFHRDNRTRCPDATIKSVLWQVLNGVSCLHSNWFMHRDLKPSNVLVMGEGPEQGVVKIADFGLARSFQAPARRLSDDGVVVTIWYRAPELLLGSKHYTKAIDIWAVGCIFAELINLKALFPGTEQKDTQFQTDQLEKIFQVLGFPTMDQWSTLGDMPFYPNIRTWDASKYHYTLPHMVRNVTPKGLDLLARMLLYDPTKRITAEAALRHEYFSEEPLPDRNAFAIPNTRDRAYPYPERAVTPMETSYHPPSAPVLMNHIVPPPHHHHQKRAASNIPQPSQASLQHQHTANPRQHKRARLLNS